MNRSERRARTEKMKHRARRIFPGDRNAHTLANHMAFCNGYCCISKRREISGPTLRELRFAESIIDSERA